MWCGVLIALSYLCFLFAAASLISTRLRWDRQFALVWACFGLYLGALALLGVIAASCASSPVPVLLNALVLLSGISIVISRWLNRHRPLSRQSHNNLQTGADASTVDMELRVGVQLRVAQANILLGGADMAALADQVRRHSIDVLLVEELTADAVSRLSDAGLDTQLPYNYLSPHGGGSGTGIWSRYPLRDPERHHGFIFANLSVHVLVPGAAAVQVWAVHLSPPWPFPAFVWVEEIQKLAELLARRDADAVIIGGDFNATHEHARFRDLVAKANLVDAALAGARDRLSTFPRHKLLPVLCLDHILVRGAQVVSAMRLDLVGSDHMGVLAQLRLPTSSLAPSAVPFDGPSDQLPGRPPGRPQPRA